MICIFIKWSLDMDRITGLREVAEATFQEALLAADPVEAVLRNFRVKEDVLIVGDVDYFLSQFQRIFVVGAGKGAARMARAVEQVLGMRIHDGIVIVRQGYGERLGRIRVAEAGHPVPDQAGLKATSELISLVEQADENDLVICLISGGGSSLLVSPARDINLDDLQKATELFLSSGMSIQEINTVRKHISRIKGGRFAQKIFPATLITLILSDVIGDRLDVIASGPTVPDPSTFSQAVYILEKYKILDQMPARVRAVLEKGSSGDEPETPDETSEIFRRVQNLIVGSNRLSLKAAEYKARRMGMNTMILSSSIRGEAREVAKFYAALAEEILKSGSPVKAPACLIAGGEPTVTVRGSGKGGRNQELALAVALEIQNLPGIVFLSAGTDGTDGPTDAAGAFSDSETIIRARHRMINPQEYLDNNNSYEFFLNLGDLINTGPTGTNVMDIHLVLVG
jgi:glycerate 2-kinase